MITPPAASANDAKNVPSTSTLKGPLIGTKASKTKTTGAARIKIRNNEKHKHGEQN